MYKHVSEKRFLTKEKNTSRRMYRRKCEDFNKIISPIQDKISLLLLLSKIVLKFINFHTHFAVRLPQQRFFFFFFNYSYSVNYLKVRDTISVIIFICTLYLFFFCFILLRFREVSLWFVITRTIILLPHRSSRYGWRRIVIWLATARDSFETRRSQINQKFLVLHQQLYTQWSCACAFRFATNNNQLLHNLKFSSFILIRGYSVCSNKKSTTISIKEEYESSVTIEGTKVICSLQGIPTERPFWSLSLSMYPENDCYC